MAHRKSSIHRSADTKGGRILDDATLATAARVRLLLMKVPAHPAKHNQVNRFVNKASGHEIFPIISPSC
jgi:hypothetical protein